MTKGKGLRVLGLALTFGAFSVANAQSVNMWFSQAGSTADTRGDVIVPVGASSVTLSVWMTTQGAGPLTQISSMLAYTVTGSQGETASPINDGIGITHTGTGSSTTTPGLTWNPTYASGIVTRFGGGYAESGQRPYGMWTNSLNLSGTFPSADGINARLYDVVVNLDPAWTFGTYRTLTLHPATQGDTWSSYVFNDGATADIIRAPRYRASIVIGGVPEPASMLALGLGAAALLRRRRNSSK